MLLLHYTSSIIYISFFNLSIDLFCLSVCLSVYRRQLEKYAINGVQNAELRFRVQYYVTSVTKLEFEVTRLVKRKRVG